MDASLLWGKALVETKIVKVFRFVEDLVIFSGEPSTVLNSVPNWVTIGDRGDGIYLSLI